MATATATPATQRKMALNAVTRGKIKAPWRVLLYGTEGIGKSTFAAGAPSPIFLPTEDGTNELDVARFPRVERWQDIADALDALTTETHEYKTLVVDTVSAAEPLCWRHVCETYPGKKLNSIEDAGYGKGYTKALEVWLSLLNEIERLQSRTGMHVILIGHADIKRWKNPEDEDFDRYTLRMHEKSAGVLKGWANEVLFAKYETFAVDKNGGADGPKRGVSTGARLLHTQRTAAWDAKERHGLPDTLPLSWSDFETAMIGGLDPSALAAKVRALAASVGGDDAAKATAALDRAGDDAQKIGQLLNWLRSRPMTKEESAQ